MFGFFKNIKFDYQSLSSVIPWNTSDHGMWPRESYLVEDVDEYGDVTPYYHTGYYTPENTQIWQTRREQVAWDLGPITQEIPVIDHTVTFIKIDPGRTVPWHRDVYYLLKQKNPDWKERQLIPIRYLIFLKDWKLGQFVQFEHQVITGWCAGDCWYFCHQTYHLGTNAGLDPIVTMQISGFQPG